MEIRYSSHPEDVKYYTTEELRDHFLIPDLFQYGEIKSVYCHEDRMIVGSAVPTTAALAPEDGRQLGCAYFMERREMGILNIGGEGRVKAGDADYSLQCGDALYVGMGTKELSFSSENPTDPAKFYFVSVPAHEANECVKISKAEAIVKRAGSEDQCNTRTILQYIHPSVCKSCQLLMGVTALDKGSVWNAPPFHTHERRAEAFLYFDMQEEDVVFYFMGHPTETRHLVVRQREAVLSPSWSMHGGCGTGRYSVAWAMAGENQAFDDMDAVSLADIQ